MAVWGANAQEKYYWYVGAENPTSISNVQTDISTAGWHEIGESIPYDFMVDLNENSIKVSETRINYYVVIPNSLHVYAEDPDYKDQQWYVAVPLDYHFVPSVNGTKVGGWSSSLVTIKINSVEYIVFKALQLTDAVNMTLTNIVEYYWYAGPDMLTSATVPAPGGSWPMITTDSEQIGWHKIDGEPTSIATGDLAVSEKINWVFAVPTKFGLNALSNGEDVTDLYEVSTVTCADGVEYYVFKQIEPSKRASLIFVKSNGNGNADNQNLVNPSFDHDLSGWTNTNGTARWKENTWEVLSNYCEFEWTGGPIPNQEVVQFLTLPAGNYRLSVDCASNANSQGLYLVAGNNTKELLGAEGINSFSLEFSVAEESQIKIGFKVENTTATWVNFDNFKLENISSSDINSIKTDHSHHAVIYDLSGQRLSKPQKGINIIGGKKVAIK